MEYTLCQNKAILWKSEEQPAKPGFNLQEGLEENYELRGITLGLCKKTKKGITFYIGVHYYLECHIHYSFNLPAYFDKKLTDILPCSTVNAFSIFGVKNN